MCGKSIITYIIYIIFYRETKVVETKTVYYLVKVILKQIGNIDQTLTTC